MPACPAIYLWLPGQKTLGKRLTLNEPVAACYNSNVNESDLAAYLRTSPPVIRIFSSGPPPSNPALSGTSPAQISSNDVDVKARTVARAPGLEVAKARLDLVLIISGKDVRYDVPICDGKSKRVGEITVEATYRTKAAFDLQGRKVCDPGGVGLLAL